MNVTINNANHQITTSLGKNGVLKFGLGDSQKMTFNELQGAISSKIDNDEERVEALRVFQLPDEILQRSLARTAKSNIFREKWELAKAGDMDSRNNLIDLFSSFGLERFLTRNMNDSNNFVTNILSMSPGEKAAFLRLEEYILSGRG